MATVEHYGTNSAQIHYFGWIDDDGHHSLVVMERHKDDGTVLTSMTYDGAPLNDPDRLAPSILQQVERLMDAQGDRAEGGPRPVNNLDEQSALSRDEVLVAARALCPEDFGFGDALQDLVSTVGWAPDSTPGRVMRYQAMRVLGCRVDPEHDSDMSELIDDLGDLPVVHESWRIRRYATLGSLIGDAIRSAHYGEDLDEVRELLRSATAGAWPWSGSTYDGLRLWTDVDGSTTVEAQPGSAVTARALPS